MPAGIAQPEETKQPIEETVNVEEDKELGKFPLQQ
jgi:hypothetical protein